MMTTTAIGREHFPVDVYENQIGAAVEAVEWRPIIGEWPAMPGLAIKAAIQEFRIPGVVQAGISERLIRVEDGAEYAEYALYGIEGNYKDGVARIYFVDRGHDLIPVLSEFVPTADLHAREVAR